MVLFALLGQRRTSAPSATANAQCHAQQHEATHISPTDSMQLYDKRETPSQISTNSVVGIKSTHKKLEGLLIN